MTLGVCQAGKAAGGKVSVEPRDAGRKAAKDLLSGGNGKYE